MASRIGRLATAIDHSSLHVGLGLLYDISAEFAGMDLTSEHWSF